MATGGRRSGRIIIIISLILILMVVLVYVIMGRSSTPTNVAVQLATPTPSEQMGQIVITTQRVSRGATLSESVLTVVPYPKKDIIEGVFYTDMKMVIGKRARFDMEAQLPVTKNLLVDEQQAYSLAAFNIPRGMVAISIPMGKLSSVAYALENGDHVNVIASLLLVDIDPAFQSSLPNLVDLNILSALTGQTPSGQKKEDGQQAPQISQFLQGRAEMDPGIGKPIYVIPSEKQRPRLVSQTLIQDAMVLHVGEFSLEKPKAGPTPTPQPQQGSTPPPPPPKPDVVTLVVSPQDAITLNYLMLAGARLNLVLRSAGDDERSKTEAVTLQFILDQYNIPNPAKLPYGLEPRLNEFPAGIPPFPGLGQ